MAAINRKAQKMYRNEVVVLDRGDYTTCAVNLHGAVVTSWRIQNKEHIFLSRQSELVYLSRARGGLSIAFPKYDEWEFGHRHGFARDVTWSVEDPPRRLENGDVRAAFSMKNDEYTRSLWAYKFKLTVTITLKEMELVVDFAVENTCLHFPMEFDFVHHCMFKVDDVAKCKVVGLKDCSMDDWLDPEQKADAKEDREEVTVFKSTDVTYKNAPNVIHFTVGTGGEGEEVIKITKKNLPDFHMWNPWMDKANVLKDLGNDEYKYFLSPDCGAVAKKIRLEPNGCWGGHVTYEIIEPQEEQEVIGHFYDYFDKIC